MLRYDFSIVIVSWNCREVLRTCLTHLFASRSASRFKVILVDNASSDGTTEAVAQAFPAVEIIPSGANLGFGRGNNLGFRHVEGRYVLLLNPDAYLTDPDLLDRLLLWADQHEEYGAIGCRITFPDGRHQVGDAGYRPSAGAMICAGLGLHRLSARIHGVFLPSLDAGAREAVDVDWICGAFMLVRRQILDQVGGFDESIFMYGEDVDWGCRARAEGIRLAYLPWLSVVHVQAGTQYKEARATISTRWIDSLVVVHRRLDHGRCWRAVRLAMAGGFVARAILYRLAASLAQRPGLRNKAAAMMVFARHTWSIPG